MTIFYFQSLNIFKEVVLKVFSNNFNILSISESVGLVLLTDFPLDLVSSFYFAYLVMFVIFRASLIAQLVKNPPAMQETLV